MRLANDTNGFTRKETVMKRTYSPLDMDERRKIALGRTAGLSVEKLGRHRSTIFRDIRRNTFTDAEFVDLNGYYCVTAHAWHVSLGS